MSFLVSLKNLESIQNGPFRRDKNPKGKAAMWGEDIFWSVPLIFPLINLSCYHSLVFDEMLSTPRLRLLFQSYFSIIYIPALPQVGYVLHSEQTELCSRSGEENAVSVLLFTVNRCTFSTFLFRECALKPPAHQSATLALVRACKPAKRSSLTPTFLSGGLRSMGVVPDC